MGLRDNLHSAIESLYSMFVSYPKPDKIDFCPCGCTKAETVRSLLAAPLRVLKFADLEDYSFSAMTTQGSVRDFKYFLPRLLEGIAYEPYGFNPEILFGKFHYGKWLSWQIEEVTAIRTYLTAIWEVGLNTFPVSKALPAFCETETLIAAIASTGESLDAYLSLWSESPSEETDRHLIQFITHYGKDFEHGRTMSFGFWGRNARTIPRLATVAAHAFDSQSSRRVSPPLTK